MYRVLVGNRDVKRTRYIGPYRCRIHVNLSNYILRLCVLTENGEILFNEKMLQETS